MTAKQWKNELTKDRYRIIKISKDALWEFIYESIIDNQEVFFDISDGTTITSHFDIDFEKGNLICLINNSLDIEPTKMLQLPEGIDLQALLNNMEDTTDTMCQPNRYKEFTFDEIKGLQSKRKRNTAV